MKIKKSLYLLLLIFITSCSKDADKVNPDIKGFWSSTYYYAPAYRVKIIDIKENSSSRYCDGEFCGSDVCNCSPDIEGKTKIKDKSELYIGEKKFNIEKMPYEIGNKWYMEVSGNLYERSP
jgi:hypothetical protein